MIDESQEHIKSKKSSKGKKKPEQKLIEQEPVKVQKILQQGKQMSELSELDQKEQQKKIVQNFYELTQDLISYLLLDHEQFKQEIQKALLSLKNYDTSKITHKHIFAYSLWAKLQMIEQKLQSSSIKFNVSIVQKQKEKLTQNFKKGLRNCQMYKKYYKDYTTSS